MIFGRRKKSVDELIKQIDLILHGNDSIDISVYKEGQLYILQNEINKMTLRIREQNDTLKKDKQYLSDSLADIAHQLRTPLTSANLILTLLEKSRDEVERAAFIRELTQLLVSTDWLITSLLRLSRLDADVVEFRREPVRVIDVVAAAERPIAIQMELRGALLSVDVPRDIVIYGDAGWLAEAVQNILKNCVESAGDGGKIEVVCRRNTLYTELVIHDSGAGFLPRDLPRVFDRFYRGSGGDTGGFGIGLALCKMIITRQGGTITAGNSPHGGAIFTMKFPNVTEPSPESHCDVI
jgi:signal transduction histidine kinase